MSDPRAMTEEFPVLCVNPGCRPQEHGGPRRTQRANLCDVCHDRLRENLTAIADTWPDLLDQLTRESQSELQERVRGTPDRGLVLNERASDTMREVTGWAWFVARVVDDEKNPRRGPVSDSTPDALRWVAWHVDHFAKHHDPDLAGTVADEAYGHLKAVKRAAYPSGAKRLDLGVPCRHVDIAEDGEQVSCPGTMFVVVLPQAATWPDLICTENDEHRVAPADWRRAGWRRHAHPVGVTNLLRRLAG